MTFLLETVQVVIPDILSSPPLNTSIVSISSQHFACSACDSESESVASITFKLSSADGVKEFTLPPASSFELTQLAVLFGTSHTASQRIKFDTIPGFEVSFLRNSDTTVRVSFLADQQLMHFMGLDSSCSSAHATIATSELPDLEDAIRASFAPCNK
jgi:hypothetical protein